MCAGGGGSAPKPPPPPKPIPEPPPQPPPIKEAAAEVKTGAKKEDGPKRKKIGRSQLRQKPSGSGGGSGLGS